MDRLLGHIEQGQGEEEAEHGPAQGKHPRGPPGGVGVGGDD